MLERITQLFSDSIDAKIRAADALPDIICDAAERIAQSLLNEGKIIACGNGSASGNAQHFVSMMLSRYSRERPSLPAINLGSSGQLMSEISIDANFNEVFSRQLRALSQDNDILLAFSSTGNCPNMVQAIQAAHDRNIQIIALTGGDGGDVARILQPEEIEIRVPDSNPHRIHEVHMVIIHCLCDLVDELLFSYE